MDEMNPPTQPSGDLVPPPRVPPTAIALASPAPVPLRPIRTEATGTAFGRFIDRTLDVVDNVADSVAHLLRVRDAA